MKYIKVIMYALFGILLVISSYLIILNIKHFNSLNDYVVVSTVDIDYSNYKDNINKIEEFINSHKDLDNKTYLILVKTLDSLKRSGVYRLIPKNKLNQKDIYELNDYFMEELINNSWISNIKSIDITNKYQDSITLLVNNSNYLNSIFTSNSNILYDSKLDNKIEDNYHFLLSNYYMYSKIILNICNELGGNNG